MNSSRTILYCDDNRSLRALAAMVLEAAGHKVEIAGDGQEALDKITANRTRFDILITDQSMPRLTGSELVQQLRNLNLPIKVIMTTAVENLCDSLTRSRLGIDGFLVKPYHAEDLLTCIDGL